MPFGPKEIGELAADMERLEALNTQLEAQRKEARDLEHTMFSAVVAGGSSPLHKLAGLKGRIENNEEEIRQTQQQIARKILPAMVVCAQASAKDAELIQKDLENHDIDSKMLFEAADPAKYIEDAVEDPDAQAILSEVAASTNIRINPYAGELVLGVLVTFAVDGKKEAMMPALTVTKELFDTVETFFKNPKLTSKEKELFGDIVKQIRKIANPRLSKSEIERLLSQTKQLIDDQKEPIQSAAKLLLGLASKQQAAFVAVSKVHRTPGDRV